MTNRRGLGFSCCTSRATMVRSRSSGCHAREVCVASMSYYNRIVGRWPSVPNLTSYWIFGTNENLQRLGSDI